MDKEMWLALLRIIIVLPLIGALAYLSIRYGFSAAKKTPWRGGKKRMQLIEQLALGSKCGLSLVQIGNSYVLLAHQEGSVVVVQQYDELPKELEINSTAPPEISQWLSQWGLFKPKSNK